MQSIAAISNLHRAALAACVLMAGCAGVDEGVGVIEFEAGEVFLQDFQYDTGFVPSSEPAQFRVVATSRGTMGVQALGAIDDGRLIPVEGSGELAVDAALDLEFFARFDLGDEAGIPPFSDRVHQIQVALPKSAVEFDPFLAGDQALLEIEIAPAPLANVGLDSFLPGAIEFSVLRGSVSLALGNGCAMFADGLAQFAGSVGISGHVVFGAEFRIELPLVGLQTFGPFAVRVDLPSIELDLDLGTFNQDGTPSEAAGPCTVANRDDDRDGDDNDDGDDGDGGDDGNAHESNCGLPAELAFEQTSKLSAFVTRTQQGDLVEIETAAGFFTDDAISDVLFVRLGAGEVLGEDIQAGQYSWSDGDGNRETCDLCAEIKTNIGTVLDAEPDALLVASSGQVEIVNVASELDGTIAFELKELVFHQVSLEDGQTPVDDGCVMTLTSMPISATVRNLQ